MLYGQRQRAGDFVGSFVCELAVADRAVAGPVPPPILPAAMLFLGLFDPVCRRHRRLSPPSILSRRPRSEKITTRGTAPLPSSGASIFSAAEAYLDGGRKRPG